MTPEDQAAGDVEFNAADAIQALLNSKETEPEPEEEPEPEPAAQPDPEPETPDEESEPSAEIEGAVVAKDEIAEPEKPAAVERKAEKPAPEIAAKPAEPNPQDQLLAQLNTLVPQLQAAIAGEFSDIKSFEDLQKIASEDPARYNRFVIHQAQLQHAQSEQQRLGADYQQRFYQAEAAKLAKALPDYADPVKGKAIQDELRAFAVKQGYDAARLAHVSAADVMTLYKASQWDKSQAAKAAQPAEIAAAQAKAKEKAAKAPQVQKPGAPQTNEKADRANEKAQRFQKSGHLNDLASLLIETGMA